MAKTPKTEMKTLATSKLGEAPGIDVHRPENAVSPRSDEIDRLGTMKIGELQALYAEVIGKPTRCPNRAWLVRSIVEAAVPATVGASTEAPASRPEALAAAATCAAPAPTAQSVSEAEAAMGDGAPLDLALNAAPESPSAPNVAGTGPSATEIKLSKLGVPALQALYAEVVGRPSQSSNSAYLVWKIRQARKGAVPTGPRKAARAEDTTFKVLPLRMESDLVDKLDEAWRRQGLSTRMELFRVALRTYLASVGENDVAALLKVRDA